MSDTIIQIETNDTVVVTEESISVISFGIQGPQGVAGDPGSVTWGDLTGTISNQTDLSNALSSKEPANANIQLHIVDTNNPHGVTKAHVGLDLVDNTSDLNKPISTATQTALDLKLDATESSTFVKNNQSGSITGTLTVSDLIVSATTDLAQLPTISAVPLKTALAITSADVGADASGTAATLVSAHELLADPHTQYLTEAEGAALVSAHELLADPHPQYLTAAEGATTFHEAEVAYDLGAALTGSVTADLSNGVLQHGTVTGPITWTFSGASAAPSVSSLTLKLTNAGSQTQTWPVSVTWPTETGGAAPTLEATGVSVLEFFSYDGGVSWFGFKCGAAGAGGGGGGADPEGWTQVGDYTLSAPAATWMIPLSFDGSITRVFGLVKQYDNILRLYARLSYDGVSGNSDNAYFRESASTSNYMDLNAGITNFHHGSIYRFEAEIWRGRDINGTDGCIYVRSKLIGNVASAAYGSKEYEYTFTHQLVGATTNPTHLEIYPYANTLVSGRVIVTKVDGMTGL